MRLISLLLLISLGVGCGTGKRSASTGPRAGFGFSAPSINALTPSSSPVNSAPFTMTIQGSNFGTDAVAFWNGTAQHTTFVSSSQLLVTVTDTDLMFVGLTHVFVSTGGLNSNTLDFNVTPQ
jgi:IPT/TIG domain-containing protein